MKEEKVDSRGDGGIIDPELFHKRDYKREGYHFISDKRFDQIMTNVRRQGGMVIRGGEEVEKHLDDKGAGASTVGDILFFRQEVTVSEALEEAYHFEQNKNHLNDDRGHGIRTILNEIDAKEYVLANKKKYRIPRKEVEETESQLKELKQKLEDWKD